MPSYPTTIKTFTNKQNLIDDVDAKHVNDIQDEIVAMQQALGVQINAEWFAPGGRRIEYGSLKNRLTAIQQGTDLLYATMYRSSLNVKTSTDTYLSLSASRDPYRMASGDGGLVIPQSGLWDIWGTGWWDTNSRGYRMLRIVQNNTEIVRNVQPASSAIGRAIGTTVTWKGYFAAGTKLRLAAYQTTGGTFAIHDINFAVNWVRNI